jgi:hypothetical protein
VASPFGCRSGHISAFAEATLPRDGQVGEGVSPALDAQTEKHSDPRRSTSILQQRSQTVKVVASLPSQSSLMSRHTSSRTTSLGADQNIKIHYEPGEAPGLPGVRRAVR